MSFTFEWPRFSDQFHSDAIQMLNNALNKGNKPPVIADKIEVVELEMGTQPPELEIRDIGDLTMDQFRGIFRLTYAGDAHIVLKTKVQANPLNHKQPDIHIMTGSRGMLAAKDPLVVPMLLRLSHFKLNSYVVLVVSRQKGITLVFKTDPLQNVDINSTFDSIAVIQKFIQREIEGQLRQMFREDLPGIIHRLSQQWVKAKVEAPYLDKRVPPVRRRAFDVVSAPDLSYMSPGFSGLGLHQYILRQRSLGSLPYSRARSISGTSVLSVAHQSTTSRPSSAPVPTSISVSESSSSNPELENFDPTYGLRPEGLPTKSVFSSFGRLFTPNMGLANLTEEPGEDESLEGDEEQDSFDVADWDDALPEYSPPPTVVEEPVTEYETLPAVGGGTITRPRVYHSQSMIQPSSDISHFPDVASDHSDPQTRQLHSMSGYTSPRFSSHRHQSSYNPYFPITPSLYSEPQQRMLSETTYDITNQALPPRPVTPDSLETQFSSSSGLVETPPSSVGHNDTPLKPSLSNRRLSVSSSNMNLHFDSWGSSSPSTHSTDPVILRPALNNTISQLSTLSHSNHTLSPYTRSLSHFTVRSVPPRTLNVSQMMPERPPVKAKRKRTYRIGGSKPSQFQSSLPPSPPSPSPSSAALPPEFEKSDMDRYFRSVPPPPQPLTPDPHPHSACSLDLRRRHPP